VNLPTILTVYNRPKHTKQVLDALKRHQVKNLYIFSDGPKTDVDPNVDAVRQLIREIDWTTPTIIEQKHNIGLSKSIIGAVDYVLERHDVMNLLEDDSIPGEFYFSFMQDCLTKYRDNSNIISICGTTISIKPEIRKKYPWDVYFAPRIGCVGWATWKDRWSLFVRDEDLCTVRDRAIAENLDINTGGHDVLTVIRMKDEGVLDAWTPGWLLACAAHRMTCVYPIMNLVKNIGYDGSGVHSTVNDANAFKSPLATYKLTRFPDNVEYDEDIWNRFRKFYGSKVPINRLKNQYAKKVQPPRNYAIIIDHSCLPQARILYDSMLQWCQPFHLWILAMDNEVASKLQQLHLMHTTTMHYKELKVPKLTKRDMRGTIFTYKSFWLIYLLEKHALPDVCYLDTDSQFFFSPQSIFQEIAGAPLAITPHRFSPQLRNRERTCGRFNAGFIFATPRGLKCLYHWRDQCVKYCSGGPCTDGVHCGDQKYLDTWDTAWDAHVIKHKGVNLSTWNQTNQYTYTIKQSHIYVDGEPLIWYHFHEKLLPLERGALLDPVIKQHIYPQYKALLEG